jgi:type II secretory pathway pseudopilin PulG
MKMATCNQQFDQPAPATVPGRRMRASRGVSLLEMIIVLAIGITMASITFIAWVPMMKKNHVDSAYETTLGVLRNTRTLAIAQSHQYYVYFNPSGYAAGTILVEYQPPAVNGIYPALQQVATYAIPTDVSFAVMTGFPTSAPDGFGTGITAIDFGQGLGAGSLNFISLMPDGSSQDNLGNYNNGVLYISRTADTTVYQARAITVWGATGRIRGWHLYQQSSSTPIWVQQ